MWENIVIHIPLTESKVLHEAQGHHILSGGFGIQTWVLLTTKFKLSCHYTIRPGWGMHDSHEAAEVERISCWHQKTCLWAWNLSNWGPGGLLQDEGNKNPQEQSKFSCIDASVYSQLSVIWELMKSLRIWVTSASFPTWVLHFGCSSKWKGYSSVTFAIN